MRGLLLVFLSVVLLAGCTSAGKRKEIENNVAFHYRMGMAHLEDHDYQNGLVEFRKAEQLDAENGKVLFAMGHAYFSQGNYPQAKIMMERVLAIDPGNGEALNYLGNIQEKLGDLDGAIASFTRAATLPDYRTPQFSLHNMGRIYLARGETDKAEQAFISAIKRVPEYYPARADLARLYLDSDRWREAVEQWKVFVDLVPNIADGHYFLARAYVGVGKPDKAKIELATFIRTAPADHPLLPDAEALMADLGE